MKAVVLGSGGWGTALSMDLRDNGHETWLWSHHPDKAAQMAAERENSLGVTGGAEWSQFHKNLIFSVPNVPEGVEWVRLSYDRGGVAWSVTVPLK